jgi:hypothetical protein
LIVIDLVDAVVEVEVVVEAVELDIDVTSTSEIEILLVVCEKICSSVVNMFIEVEDFMYSHG